jgi:hypothetical protein
MSEVERLRHTATRSKAFAVGSCLYPRAHEEVVLGPRKLLLEYAEAQELESKTRGLPERCVSTMSEVTFQSLCRRELSLSSSARRGGSRTAKTFARIRGSART